MTTTNILIVGNGFDLSHYLPTKYDHFMDVMGAIEESKSETMNFDELFSTCRDKGFITKTKQYSLTENIILEKEQLEKIRELLKENCWYKYFKKYLRDIDTWIDFESKIQDILSVFSKAIKELEFIDDIEIILDFLNGNTDKKPILTRRELDCLEVFKFIVNSKRTRYINPKSDKYNNSQPITGTYKIINKDFCYGRNILNGLNLTETLKILSEELDKFIEIFDSYLDSVIFQLNPIGMLTIKSVSWMEPDKIFSFNYTNTYQRIYDVVEVEYLHGSHGEFQNIVLGISDLEDDNLKKLKAFGFTKYHQKLFKDTDYLFLDEFKRIIDDGKQRFDTDLKLLNANALSDIRTKFIKRGLGSNATSLDLNFMIWGHSLDYSDKDYIIDLFSLNDDMDRNVRVIVFYFDKSAKFALLNNLLAILGKDKVEHWMKNKWLTFEENPKIDFGVVQKIEQEAS